MIEKIQDQVKGGEHRFTVHALERCTERNISPEEVRDVIMSGEIIEEYPQDKYGPSCLMCGKTGTGRILHVQCSIEPIWIITAYDPTLNPEEWDESFRKRRVKT